MVGVSRSLSRNLPPPPAGPMAPWEHLKHTAHVPMHEYAPPSSVRVRQVFDDSFEHEVVHNGNESRYVLYAVLHHPDLGTPRLGAPSAGTTAEITADTASVDESPEEDLDRMD